MGYNAAMGARKIPQTSACFMKSKSASGACKKESSRETRKKSIKTIKPLKI